MLSVNYTTDNISFVSKVFFNNCILDSVVIPTPPAERGVGTYSKLQFGIDGSKSRGINL